MKYVLMGTIVVLAILLIASPVSATIGLYIFSGHSWGMHGEYGHMVLFGINTDGCPVDANMNPMLFWDRVIDAAAVWTGVPTSYFTLIRANISGIPGVKDGLNIIGWGFWDVAPPKTVGQLIDGVLAVAITWFDEAGFIIEADIIFNNDPDINWYGGALPPVPVGEFDLLTVAIHEFGHWIQLDDLNAANCPNPAGPAQVMWHTLDTAVRKPLADGDIQGVSFVYATAVGGIVVPVDKFALLAPYIGLASTLLVATVATAVYVKRVKLRKEE